MVQSGLLCCLSRSPPWVLGMHHDTSGMWGFLSVVPEGIITMLLFVCGSFARSAAVSLLCSVYAVFCMTFKQGGNVGHPVPFSGLPHHVGSSVYPAWDPARAMSSLT